MTGCLTAPFKLAGCLVLVVALVFGWLYRDRLLDEGRRLLRLGSAAGEAEATGRPGVLALKSARSKVDSLAAGRADSVVLTPAEMASLAGAGMPARLRTRLDSLQVGLRDGAIAVRAQLRTDRLASDGLGPIAGLLRGSQPIEAAGPLQVVEPGRGAWEVRSFEIRGVPVPGDVVPILLGRALGRDRTESVPVRVPRGVVRVRIRPSGATLYGAPQE